MLVVELGDHDRLAPPRVRPEVLLLLLGVVRDDRVRGIQDRPGRAVVLLELHDLGPLEVMLELEDVPNVGRAEASRSICASSPTTVRFCCLAGQELEQAVLGSVRVLVLVDEEPAEGALVALADVGEELEEVDGADEEVVEVHRGGLDHAALIQRVDLGDDLLEVGGLASRRSRSSPRGGSWRPRWRPGSSAGEALGVDVVLRPCSA